MSMLLEDLAQHYQKSEVISLNTIVPDSIKIMQEQSSKGSS